MNEQAAAGKIWKPSVEPMSTQLPYPNVHNRQQFYTKTSLSYNSAADREQDEDDNTKQQRYSYNQRVLNATQAFNATPKPFVRPQVQLREPSPSNQNKQRQEKTLSLPVNFDRSNLYSKPKSVEGQQLQLSAKADSSRDLKTPVIEFIDRDRPTRSAEDKMAPKLVHNQYNSPLDLYSMNNIRKTIEAHTELIAPGIKGINFMKADTPVNKQSEVYKLVMEEEGKQRAPPPPQQPRQRQPVPTTSARLSPISGRPSNLPSSLSADYARHQAERTEHSQVTSSTSNQPQSNDAHQVSAQAIHEQREVQQTAQVHGAGVTEGNQASRVPSCCQCGQFIVGPFAKIQDKSIHPHCFNCATCGSSLKNMGYYKVNDKLYCQIHAKLVADMLRVKFDSDEQSGKHEGQWDKQNQRQSDTSNRSFTGLSVNESSSRSSSHNVSRATISTMFADRGIHSTTRSTTSAVPATAPPDNDDRHDIRWSWRPMTARERLANANAMSLEDQYEVTSSSNTLPMNQPAPQQQCKQQQQQQHSQVEVSRGRGVMVDDSSCRIPICVSCSVQIQGPYILANRTTWCKPCSQTNFVCCSCRRSLLDTGFIEDDSGNGGRRYYCEHCFETYHAPSCFKCNMGIKGDCLSALGKKWHPSCFVCGHCRRPFGNSSFYLEDNVPYCERDWNMLFTTKCYSCSLPIEAGDKWIEALDKNYHSNCFKCTSCHTNLEGSTFYCKGGKPYCRLHAR